MDYLFPPGGQRGQVVKVLPKATLKSWPADIVYDHSDLHITPGATAGEFQFQIAPEAVPGVRLLRIVNAEGASSPLPFVVSTLAEIAENEPNDDPLQAQRVEHSEVVINGRLAKPGDVDVFAVSLRASQTLLAQVDAQRLLGSPMDGVLQLLSADGFVLEQSNDSPGLDPRLVFTASRDGTYLVRLLAYSSTPDASINLSGGDRFVYRLTLTTGGLVDYAFPLAVSRPATSKEGSGEASVPAVVTPVKARLELCGWNIPPALSTIERDVPHDQETLTAFRPELAGWAEVAVVSQPAMVESEPNAASHPQPVLLPAVISGRIAEPGDVDVFTFSAEKNQRLTCTLISQRLGFELAGVLKITDAEGRIIAQQENPAKNRDRQLAFTAPATGEYRAIVEDLCRQGGRRHVYRLEIGPPAPDYELAVKAAQWTVAAGQSLEIPVAVDRQEAFDEQIEVTCAGLPDDVQCAPAVSMIKEDSSKQVQMKVTAGQRAFSGPIRLVGKSRGNLALQRTTQHSLPESGLLVDRFWLTITATAK